MLTTAPAKYRRKRIDPLVVLVFFLLAGVTAMLGRTICIMPQQMPGLENEVARHLHNSGVASPVTAVLLNFRGYDTLLEVMVLFLAVLGVWSLTRATFVGYMGDVSPVQLAMVRLLAPFMFLVAAYLVWQGSHLAGGAFQGGAVLGGAGVLMLITDLPWLPMVPARPLRCGLALGPVVFLSVALGCLIWSGGFLVYPLQAAAFLLVLIEAACALSIGLTLAALFVGGRPYGELMEEQPYEGGSGQGDE